jgi:DNA modification methylase
MKRILKDKVASSRRHVMIYKGDCLEILKTLPDESVHCVVTSPPYWGLRDYGVDGQLGLEKDFRDYVTTLVSIFREVRRVLRNDGTLWLNLGDTYSGYHGNKNSIIPTSSVNGWMKGTNENKRTNRAPKALGLKPKDLVGVPWRVAFALQEDGWWLRSDIIWSKPSPMPESVTDRPTKSHEYLFLLTKSEKYYYDGKAVAEVAVKGNAGSEFNIGKTGEYQLNRASGKLRTFDKTRNKRSVWTIATVPYFGAHFATFPPLLVEPCILAGTSGKGVCAKCGAPWKRDTEIIVHAGHQKRLDETRFKCASGSLSQSITKFKGWIPSCKCNAACIPATVLDPFGGVGTTSLVAEQLGRNSILIELNPQYAKTSARRVKGIFNQVETVDA